MTPRDAPLDGSSRRGPDDAAEWFVALDATPGHAELESRYSAWLAASPEHERAAERVELAIVLGRHLAVDPELAAGLPGAADARHRSLPSLGRIALAAAVVALAIASAWLATWPRWFAPPPVVPATLTAAEVANIDAPVSPIVVLPTGVVVDGGSVAVLPFAGGAGSDALAAGLEAEVLAALRSVPGLYVIAGTATAPYAAASDLSLVDVGSQLGVSGVVDARVLRTGARLSVQARLRDTRSGAVVWQRDFDDTLDHLARVRDAVADGIALALLDSARRVAPPGIEPALTANVPASPH
jgi:TolB-like protein